MKIQIVVSYFVIALLSACSDSPDVRKDKADSPSIESAALETESELKKGPPPIEPSLDQNASFDQFKESFLERTWALNPSYGVYVGYYKHDEKLLVPDGELRALRRAFYVNELGALKTFNANRLTPSNATDLAIIEGQLRSNLWYLDSFRSFEWNPAQYNPAGAFGVILNTDYKPLKERMLTISTRLENVPAYYAAAIANLKTPTNPHLGLAIQQTKGALSMFTTLIPEKAASVEFTLEEKTRLDQNLALAVKAVTDYAAWLDTKQAELAETGVVRDFRIGAEQYEKKFKHDIASSYSARELYELAVASKLELHTNMIAITESLWKTYFDSEPIPENRLQAVKQLIDLLAEKHVERDQFVDEIRRQIPILQAFVDEHQLLDSDPTRPLVVRLTPEYQRGFAGASVNAPGPYDATANTYYNVSPLDDYTDEQAESYLREYNHWILQILNIHEAIPGHYTQLMHANKSPSKIKSIFGNGAMVEGWAVYAERMMLEAGYANNEPEMWLMYSKWNLRVVVNTILDYSVQVLGMEQEAALDMLMNEAFQERTEAEGKWRRATVSQVQLTSYFTGYSEIYAFREQLKAQRGEAFDLRAFHNQFLSYGNAPVPVIKKLMLDELASQPLTRLNNPSLDSMPETPSSESLERLDTELEAGEKAASNQ